MSSFLKGIAALGLSTFAAVALAAPANFVAHNNTDEESNAFIAGTIPSPTPTKPHSTNKTAWFVVKMACFGHMKGNRCPAVVKMATNTSQPIVVGELEMDLETGDISPKTLSGNGYTVIVNGPGEATINKD